MLFTRQFVLVFAMLAALAGCGGGSDEPAALSPQAIAQHAKLSAAAPVSPADAAEVLLNAAEGAHANLFPVHKTTGRFGVFAYRYYPETNMYLGVAIIAGPTYTQNGIYVVGAGFGTLASPSYQGTINTFFPSLVIDTGLSGNKTLHITVSVYGQSASVDVLNVPVPVTQVDFCGALTSDATLLGLLSTYGASFTVTGCSFTGTSGSFSANVTVTGYPTAVPVTVTYTYS